MNKLTKELERVENKIKNKEYQNIESIDDWGGANVCISKEKTKDLTSWIANQPEEIYNLDFEAPDFVEDKRRIVITSHVKELSWLFCELRDAFYDYIDFRTKFQFYGLLAQSANNKLKESPNCNCQDLLNHVLNFGAWKYIKLNESTFKGIA